MLAGTSYRDHTIDSHSSLFERLGLQSPLIVLGSSISGILLLCYADYLTGYEVNLSVFYAFPVIYTVWFCGKAQGFGIALLGVMAWYLADSTAGHVYSQYWMWIWNALVKFSFLALVVHGVGAVKSQRQISHAETKSFHGILPVCTGCKRIRDEDGYWAEIETYICDHSPAQTSPKLCPECSRRSFIQRITPKRELMPLNTEQISF